LNRKPMPLTPRQIDTLYYLYSLDPLPAITSCFVDGAYRTTDLHAATIRALAARGLVNKSSAYDADSNFSIHVVVLTRKGVEEAEARKLAVREQRRS